MKHITYILASVFFVLVFPTFAHAQLKTPPKIEWQRSLGGSSNEYARSAQQTSDGGYIVVGYSTSIDGDVKKINDGYDCWVLKVSSAGITEWTKLFGGNSIDRAASIRETKEGSYIIAGYSSSDDVDVKGNNGRNDFWIVNLTDDSVLTWESSLGGTDEDEASSVIPTFDGGYIAVGHSYSTDGMVIGNHGESDCWVVKLSGNGGTQWARSYGGSSRDGGTSIQQTSDSGYIIAGYSFSNDGNVAGHHGETSTSDYWIIKLSKEGDIEWQRSLGGSGVESANDIKQTSDGGYIVVGYSQSIDGDVNGHHGAKGSQDMWIVKLTANGSIEWDRSLGGASNDRAYSVCEANDGGYVIAGHTYSHDGNVSFNHGALDYWIVKLSNSGILEWERSYGGSQSDYAYSIEQTTDGGFIVAGNSISNDGDVTGNHEYADFWIVKLSPENPTSVEAEPAAFRSVSIIPNPARTNATLSFESYEEGVYEVLVISLTGATIKQYSAHISIGKQEVFLTDLASLPSGMYQVLVKRNGYLMSQTKLIIE